MAKGISYFINDENCFCFQNHSLISSKKIQCPINFKTPNILKGIQLKKLGNIGAKTLLKKTKANRIHLFGVPTRGIPLASSIAMKINDFGVNSAVLILKDDYKDHKSAKKSNNTFNVLVDNSIKTGETVKQKIKQLQDVNINVNLIITIFDYCVLNYMGIDPYEDLAKRLNIEIASLFNIIDLIKFFRSEKRMHEYFKIIEFAEQNCNNHVRNYIRNIE